MVILQTERLILRTWQKKDVKPLTAINRDPKVCEFLPSVGDKNTTAAFIDRMKKHYKKYGYCLYPIELKNNHEFIGWTGLAKPTFKAHFTPAVEIGWRLASHHWNKGYATEAAKAVLNYAFTKLNFDEIVSFTTVNNKASRRVMEKIGLQHNPDDDFDHPKLDKKSSLRPHVLYRLSKSDYLK